MKAFLAAIFLFVIADFAVNHGHGTQQALRLARHFTASVTQAGRESVFNQ